MNILELIYMWPPEVFIQRHVMALAAASDQHTITLAACKAITDQSSARQQVDADFPFHEITLPQYYRSSIRQRVRLALRHTLILDRYSSLPLAKRVFIRALTALKPDLVHFHFGQLASEWAWCPQMLGIPYTVSIRGNFDVLFWQESFPKTVAPLITALKGASAIHTVGDGQQALLRQIPGINAPIRTIRTIAPLIATSNTASTSMKLVTAGRLNWIKGFGDLIRAMLYLTDATLDIFGDGQDREYLTFLILSLKLQDRVRLRGSVSNEVWLSELSTATAYVQTSLMEGFSNALAEAMAHGKPVFVTAVGCTSEIIQDHVNGIVIAVGDPIQMAQQLGSMRDTALMAQLGAAARESARQHFDAAQHGAAFVEFYEQAVAQTTSVKSS